MRFSSSQARGPAAEALPRLQLSLTARATGIVPRQVRPCMSCCVASAARW